MSNAREQGTICINHSKMAVAAVVAVFVAAIELFRNWRSSQSVWLCVSYILCTNTWLAWCALAGTVVGYTSSQDVIPTWDAGHIDITLGSNGFTVSLVPCPWSLWSVLYHRPSFARIWWPKSSVFFHPFRPAQLVLEQHSTVPPNACLVSHCGGWCCKCSWPSIKMMASLFPLFTAF